MSTRVSEKKKLSVNLSSRMEQMLNEVCETTDWKQTDAVHEAIRLLHFMVSERAEGRKILTVDEKKEQVRELYLNP